MAVPADTVGLAIAVVNGVVKLGLRLDRLLAEKTAGDADMVMPEGTLTLATPAAELLDMLKTFATETRALAPDPLGADRANIEALINRQDPPDDQVGFWIKKYQPEALAVEILQPDVYVEVEITRLGLHGLDQNEIKQLTYFIGPGRTVSDSKLAWRIALLVVDVLAEFTIEAQDYVVRDPQTQQVVAAILTRFATGDLEEEEPSAQQLLRRALQATLNGLLDAREVWDGDNVWLDMVLSALAEARESAVVKDDYLIGLLRGQGYRPLVRELLEKGSERLGEEAAKSYRTILADVLKEAAVHVDESEGFAEFFQAHWTDLTRAGLRSFDTHGPAILQEEHPILREALIAAVRALADPGTREFFSPDSFIAATEAAIAAIVAKPELLGDTPDWARMCYGAFASVVADQGLRKTYTAQGLEAMVRQTVVTVSAHPELIIDEPGLPQTVVASILKKVAVEVDGNGNMWIEAIATAAVNGALSAIAETPNLLKTEYAALVAEVAGALAKHVRERTITGIEAKAIVEVVARTVASKPELVAADATPTLVKTLGLSMAELIAERSLRQAFSASGLTAFARKTLTAVGAHPELILKNPGLPHEIVGTILIRVAAAMPATGDLRLEAVAMAAVDGVLTTLAENPQLLEFKYAEVVADVAESIAKEIRAGAVTHRQAQHLIATVTAGLGTNPEFFITVQKDLARLVVVAVIAAAARDEKNLLAGSALVQVVQAAISVLSARGVSLLGSGTAETLAANVAQLVEESLKAAVPQIGLLLDVPSVPLTIATLMERWSRGEVPNVHVEDEDFRHAFAEIAVRVRQSRELLIPTV